MAFPVTSAPTISDNTASEQTSHTITAPPDSVADSLIVAFINSRADDIEPPAGGGGWTTLISADLGTVVCTLFIKKDSGSEPSSWTFTTPNARRSVGALYRVYNWGGTLADDVDNGVHTYNGFSSTMTFPYTAAGWGSADNMYICGGYVNENTNPTIDTDPTSYTSDGINGESRATAGVKLQTWRREYASSSDTPGSVDLSSATTWSSTAVVVKPGSAGPAPSAGGHAIVKRFGGVPGMRLTRGVW